MFVLIGLFPTYQWHQSCWRGSSTDQLLVTSSQVISFLIVSPFIDLDFPPRQLCCACCQTFWRRLMKGTLQFWRYSTCQKRSTRPTILVRCLHLSYGFNGTVCESYFSIRRQSVRHNSKFTAFTMVTCGISQRSVLWPIFKTFLFRSSCPDLRC